MVNLCAIGRHDNKVTELSYLCNIIALYETFVTPMHVNVADIGMQQRPAH